MDANNASAITQLNMDAQHTDISTQHDMSTILEMTRNLALSTGNLTQQTISNTKQLAIHDQLISGVIENQGILSDKFDEYKKNERISGNQRNEIRRTVAKRVAELLGVPQNKKKRTDAQKAWYEVCSHSFFQELNGYINIALNVGERSDIRAIDFNKAIEIAKNWTPEGGIKAKTEEACDNWKIKHPECDLDEYLMRLPL